MKMSQTLLLLALATLILGALPGCAWRYAGQPGEVAVDYEHAAPRPDVIQLAAEEPSQPAPSEGSAAPIN